MCGRFSISAEVDGLVAEYVADGGRARDWRPSYSIAPTQRAPIVRDRDDDGTIMRELELASWGLRPGWAKPTMPAPINARIETAAVKPMFSAAFASHRCLVPMAPGYFEWEEHEDGKQPYLIHGDGILAAAGLYTARSVDDVWQVSFTIITTDAVDAAGRHHDRMPAFVQRELWDGWLAPGKLDDRDGMLAQLRASSAAVAATMDSYPVTRALNNTRTVDRTDPALVAPLETAT